MSLYREQGIVLRTYKLGETDRILHVFTQGRGKVRAVAKGIRRPGSRFGGRLEPFSHVDLQFYTGRNLDVVSQVELIESFSPLRESFSFSACATTMVEAADRVAQEGERNLPLFLLLRAGLQALLARPPYPAIFVDAYLLRLAGISGFHVFVDACANCRQGGEHRYLSVTAGGMLCRSCAPPGTKALEGDVIALVRLLASTDWSALPASAEQIGARRTAAAFVRAFVEYHLDRRLRSYELVPR